MKDIEDQDSVNLESNPPGWSEPGTLQDALLNVMREVTYLQKKSVSGVKWKAILELDVMTAFRPALIRNRLTFRVIETKLLHTEIFETGDGDRVKRAFRTIVNIAFRFRFQADGRPVEDMEGSSIGEAHSFGGMSTASAVTMAVKYAFRESFVLPTGDDPDVNPPSQFERTTQKKVVDDSAIWRQAKGLIDSASTIEILEKRVNLINAKGVPNGYNQVFEELVASRRSALQGQPKPNQKPDDSFL